MRKKTLRCAFRATLPVMAGYLVLGIGFGILLFDAGFSCWWAILMSVTIYAGAMQYVGVNLLAAAVSLPTAALMTLGVNARHLFYGISMVEKYRDMGKARPYLAFALTDETYSLVCDARLPGEVDPKGYYFWVSLLNQAYWVLGSLLGSLLGGTLGMDTAGVDFSMTALFVVIFLDQWEKSETHTPALIGAAAAGSCLLIFGPDRFLIPAMVLIVAGLFAGKPWIERGKRL